MMPILEADIGFCRAGSKKPDCAEPKCSVSGITIFACTLSLSKTGPRFSAMKDASWAPVHMHEEYGALMFGSFVGDIAKNSIP